MISSSTNVPFEPIKNPKTQDIEKQEESHENTDLAQDDFFSFYK